MGKLKFESEIISDLTHFLLCHNLFLLYFSIAQELENCPKYDFFTWVRYVACWFLVIVYVRVWDYWVQRGLMETNTFELKSLLTLAWPCPTTFIILYKKTEKWHISFQILWLPLKTPCTQSVVYLLMWPSLLSKLRSVFAGGAEEALDSLLFRHRQGLSSSFCTHPSFCNNVLHLNRLSY